MRQRMAWAMLGALALGAVLALARVALAGPLDPPGPVGSTMRTIDELMPSWGKKLPSSGGCASTRFTCVLPTAGAPSGEGVLDHETGLVWQRVPSTTTFTYDDADSWCRTTKIGDRYGWRLPQASELMSLIDDTQNDSLPAGDPFTITNDVYYWTQTSDSADPQLVQSITFLQGGNAVSVEPRARSGAFRAFCVRGTGDTGEPQAADEVPSWSRWLDATGGCHSARFECVLPTIADATGEGVLDRETGLVWQRVPRTTPDTWSNSLTNCDAKAIGGRLGWRMPDIDELATLLDVSVTYPSPSLPSGHPFNLGGGAPEFWTTNRFGGGSAREIVAFLGGGVGLPGGVTLDDTSALWRVWCVRGGNGHHPE